MNINQFAGLDKKYLAKVAKDWETEYFKTHNTDNWKGYIQIMNHLGKINDIPKKDGLKAHLNVLAMMETA